KPRAAKRLRILSSRGPIVKTTARQSAEEKEFARLFAAARYDWTEPLSPKTYAAWREALLRKVDEVSTADPASSSIKTTTDDSELISAPVTLRKSDWEPLAGRFEFRNREWVEMTELPDQPGTPASTIAGTIGGAPRQPGAPPDLSPAATPAVMS